MWCPCLWCQHSEAEAAGSAQSPGHPRQRCGAMWSWFCHPPHGVWYKTGTGFSSWRENYLSKLHFIYPSPTKRIFWDRKWLCFPGYFQTPGLRWSFCLSFPSTGMPLPLDPWRAHTQHRLTEHLRNLLSLLVAHLFICTLTARLGSLTSFFKQGRLLSGQTHPCLGLDDYS